MYHVRKTEYYAKIVSKNCIYIVNDFWLKNYSLFKQLQIVIGAVLTELERF